MIAAARLGQDFGAFGLVLLGADGVAFVTAVEIVQLLFFGEGRVGIRGRDGRRGFLGYGFGGRRRGPAGLLGFCQAGGIVLGLLRGFGISRIFLLLGLGRGDGHLLVIPGFGLLLGGQGGFFLARFCIGVLRGLGVGGFLLLLGFGVGGGLTVRRLGRGGRGLAGCARQSTGKTNATGQKQQGEISHPRICKG